MHKHGNKRMEITLNTDTDMIQGDIEALADLLARWILKAENTTPAATQTESKENQ
jgi:hypothetical protein